MTELEMSALYIYIYIYIYRRRPAGESPPPPLPFGTFVEVRCRRELKKTLFYEVRSRRTFKKKYFEKAIKLKAESIKTSFKKSKKMYPKSTPKPEKSRSGGCLGGHGSELGTKIL